MVAHHYSVFLLFKAEPFCFNVPYVKILTTSRTLQGILLRLKMYVERQKFQGAESLAWGERVGEWGDGVLLWWTEELCCYFALYADSFLPVVQVVTLYYVCFIFSLKFANRTGIIYIYIYTHILSQERRVMKLIIISKRRINPKCLRTFLNLTVHKHLARQEAIEYLFWHNLKRTALNLAVLYPRLLDTLHSAIASNLYPLYPLINSLVIILSSDFSPLTLILPSFCSYHTCCIFPIPSATICYPVSAQPVSVILLPE